MNQSNAYFKQVMQNMKSKPWCQNHPTGFIGVNKKTGENWKKCSIGYKFNEECNIRQD